jgi:stage V sporulation protein SpoVS
MKGIEKERAAWKVLSKAVPKSVPGAVAGGVGRKQEEEMK